MSDWSQVQIKDIAKPGRENFIDGDWVEAPHVKDKGVRLIQTGNIGVGKFIDRSKKYISEESFKELNCKEVLPHDVLVCRLAEPVGRSCIVPDGLGKSITSVDVVIFRINEELYDKGYIVQSINTQEFLGKCLEVSAGSTRTRISRTNLGQLTISCPTKRIQQKIAKILTKIDQLIEKTQALIDKHTAIKQGMMADLFTRGIDPTTGQLRPPVEQALHLYKETELGWVPWEWSVSNLGEISEKITSGSRDWAAYYADEGDIFVRISNLTREHINFRWNSVKYVDIGNGSEGDRTRLESGDMLISITADLGIIGVVGESIGRAFINQHTALVRFNKKIVNPRFAGNFLNSINGKNQFELFNDSGAKAGLNLTTIASIKCFIPSLGEQNKVADRIELIDLQIEMFKNDKNKYQNQKNGLMQDLLTGKKQVT